MRRFGFILLPLFIGLGAVWSVLSVPSAQAQTTYYLFPAVITDTLPFTYNQEGSQYGLTGHVITATGTCQHTWPSWDSCGYYVALDRGGADIVGLMIDWIDRDSDRPDYNALNTTGINIGTAAILDQNVADSVDLFPRRWCISQVGQTYLDAIDNIGCDLYNSAAWDPDSNGPSSNHNATSVSGQGDTNGASWHLVVAFYWVVTSCPDGWTSNGNGLCLEDEEGEPPPIYLPIDPYTPCTFQYTDTVTSTNGTIGTAYYSYTVNANLITNFSFEESDPTGYSPEGWTFTSDVPPVSNDWWGNSPLIAHLGNRYLGSYQQSTNYELVQDLPLYATGRYMAGVYVKPYSAYWQHAISVVNLRWNGSLVATGYAITNTWNVFTGTRIAGTGSSWLEVEYYSLVPGSNTDIYGDDVFIFPVDEDNDILCSPEYYPVPEPITTTIPTGQCAITFGDLCFPSPGDTSCWDCDVTLAIAILNPLNFGGWINWLACQIRNLFFCHLYNWILAIANLMVGIYNNIWSYLDWFDNLPNTILAWIIDTVNDVIDWFNEVWIALSQGLRTFLQSLMQRLLDTPLVQFLYGVLSRLELLIEFGAAAATWFINALRTLGLALIALVELVIDLFEAVIQAFIDPEYDWSLVPGANPDGGFLPEDLGGDGATPQKILWLLLLGMAVADASIGDLGIEALQYIPIGLMSIGIILWTLKKWEFILPAA